MMSAIITKSVENLTVLSKQNSSQAAAWIKDMKAILATFISLRAQSCASKNSERAPLSSLASFWEQLAQELILHGQRLLTKGQLSRVDSPYLVPRWRVQGDSTPPCVDHDVGLKLATLGWWEIRQATSKNISVITDLLQLHHIDICCITGMPTQHLISFLTNHQHYSWHGQPQSNCEGTGLFVAKRLQALTTTIQTSPALGPRVVVIRCGPHIIQAVYSPWLGRTTTSHTRSFLGSVIQSHAALQRALPQGRVWTMGDFNLQGVAPGPAARVPR